VNGPFKRLYIGDLGWQRREVPAAREGLSNPEIAARLFITPNTVKDYLSKGIHQARHHHA
jgi:DNA-binding NarL/FixJ family response regulator